MRIAITGATGYVGSKLIELYGDGFDIVALTRNAARARRVGEETIVGTDYSEADLVRVFGGCDAVVHLAYALATRDNEAAGLAAYEASMEATRNVLRAAEAAGVTNVIFASSRLVYPNFTETAFLETDATAPINHYGESKVRMEDFCMECNRDRGMAVKVLRFGQIIGGDMRVRSLFSVFFENALRNAPLTLIGSNVRDYIYDKDVCKAIVCAAAHPACSGIYNISMGVGTDNRAMADVVLRVTGSRSEVVVQDGSGGDRIVLDCGKAERDLGFRCDYDSMDKIVADVLACRQAAAEGAPAAE